MTWIRTVPDKDADGRVKKAYDQVQSERGVVANLYRAQSLHPEALTAQLGLHMALLHASEGLTRREREMVGLVISSRLKCNYCMTHHADAVGRYVKEPGLVPLLVADYKKAKLTPRERAILDHAVKLTEKPQDVKAADVEILREQGLTDEEILDVTLLTGYFNYVARAALGLGVENDDVAQPYKY